MPVDVKKVAGPVQLGEGPHWDSQHQYLLYVDIEGGHVHRFYPDAKKHQQLIVEGGKTGNTVSFVLPVETRPDLLVVGLGRSVAVVEWPINAPDQLTVKPKCILADVDDHHPTNRFNDAKCDPSGRIWAGTMAADKAPGVLDPELGGLFRLDTNLSISKEVDKINLSNGLAWSLDKKTFYYIDSSVYRVDAFDYDDATGKLGNRRTVLDYKAAGLDPDIPDGMCIDQDGNLWVANFYGKKVICVDPKTGKVLRQVEMPAPNNTSVCWGGKDYDTLYVTSARTGVSEEKLKKDTQSGAVFAVTGLGVKGLPSQCFKVNPDILAKKMA